MRNKPTAGFNPHPKTGRPMRPTPSIPKLAGRRITEVGFGNSRLTADQQRSISSDMPSGKGSHSVNNGYALGARKARNKRYPWP
jgi:hypothetical protein